MSYSRTHKEIEHLRATKDSLFYLLLGLGIIFLAAPVIVYFFHIITFTAVKIIASLMLLLLISNIVSKLLFYFFENYDAFSFKSEIQSDGK